MYKPIIVALLILALFVAIVHQRNVSSMSSTNVAEILPPQANIERELGNGWFMVQIEGKTFLYHYRGRGYARIESITFIPTEVQE